MPELENRVANGWDDCPEDILTGVLFTCRGSLDWRTPRGVEIALGLFRFRLAPRLPAADKWADQDGLVVILPVTACASLRLPCGGILRWRPCRTGRKDKQRQQEFRPTMGTSFNQNVRLLSNTRNRKPTIGQTNKPHKILSDPFHWILIRNRPASLFEQCHFA